MSTLAHVVAEAACRALVLQGADAVDAGDAAGFAELFVPDGVLVRPNGSVLQGRAAIAAAYAARDPDRLTQHLISNQQVLVDLATGIASARCKVLLWTGRHSTPHTPQGRVADALTQVGEFEDTLVQTADGWRLRRREARFILQQP
jgi:uncharacterized protein (TIGR02246 family)